MEDLKKEFTKKQLAAIKNIIAVERYRAFGGIKTDGMGDGFQVGVMKDCGWSIPGGYISFHAPDNFNVSGLPTDKREKPPRSAFEFIRESLEGGGYCVINKPFDGKIALSKFRKQLEENAKPVPDKHAPGGQVKTVVLHAPDPMALSHEERKIQGMYNADYLRYAVEAVGKNPVIYIGFGREDQNRDYPHILC